MVRDVTRVLLLAGGDVPPEPGPLRPTFVISVQIDVQPYHHACVICSRDGAKTLFQDAKTGVGAMSASIGSWQKQQQDGRDAPFSRYAASTPRREREPGREQYERAEEYEVGTRVPLLFTHRKV